MSTTSEQRLILVEWEQEGKRKKKKTYEISLRRKKSGFQRIEGEEILRVRNANSAKAGKK